MRKLISIFILSFLFIGCGSDDDKSNNDELKFIQVKVTSDDSKTPNGIISLFYLGDNDITGCGITGEIVFANRTDGSMMFPVSKQNGDKLSNYNTQEYAIKSFYWDELSSSYGTPQPGKKYAIFIKLSEGKNPRAYKVLTISKNSSINVHIPSASEYGETVNANWSISDYQGS